MTDESNDSPFAPRVKLQSLSAAPWRQRIAGMVRALQKNGTKKTQIDGFLVTLQRFNRSRSATVLDPPAYLLMAGRQRTGNGTTDKDSTYVEAHHPLYAVQLGRDALAYDGFNAPVSFSMPVTTAEPYAYQSLGTTVPSTPPNEPYTATDFTGRLASSLDVLPGSMALATSFTFHTSTNDVETLDAAEIRLELLSPPVHRTVYRLAADNKTVIVENPAAEGLVGTGSLRLGDGQFGSYGLTLEGKAGGNGVGWATGSLQRVEQGLGYAAVATQRGQRISAANDDRIIPHLWIGQARLQEQGSTVVSYPLDNPILSNLSPSGVFTVRGAISGGQWVRLGEEAVCLVGYTGYITSGATGTTTYPCQVVAYRLTADGGLAQNTVQSGLWRDVNGLRHELSPLVLGGCAVDEDAYFLASSPIQTGASSLRLFRLSQGGLTLLQQFNRVYPSAWHAQFSRGSHLAYMGNRKLVFIYASGSNESSDGLLVDLKLATLHLDTGTVAVLGDPGAGTFDTVWNLGMLAGTMGSYQSLAQPFCGGLDVIRPELADAGGTVTQQAILLLTVGGLGTYNATQNAVGTTWISRDSGSTWQVFANAGSGVATRYVGNLLQFRT